MSTQQRAWRPGPGEPGSATRLIAVQGADLGEVARSGGGRQPRRRHSVDVSSRHTADDGWAAQCHRPAQPDDEVGLLRRAGPAVRRVRDQTAPRWEWLP